MKQKILILDDDHDILLTTRVILKHDFPEVITEKDPAAIPELLEKHDFDVILLDMNFSPGRTDGREGVEWLRKIRDTNPDIPVVMITAYGEVELAVKAMKEGATDFVVKPWDNEKLLATVMSAYRLGRSRKEAGALRRTQEILVGDMDQPFAGIIAQSKAMKDILNMVEKVAVTDANVLILGENGTGKEVIARAIHRQSPRNGKIFMAVDLGAIPESLFEAELFGYMKGSFTGAIEDRPGRFEAASGGTLFLDEIGNLSPAMQSKLLTAIQNRSVTRIGSNKPVSTDIRLISATNMPLQAMVSENRFRQDLLYRINTVEIILPPLRERREDIPLLVKHFLKLYANKYRKKIRLSDAALRRLRTYDFPGNVRELQHLVERAVILTGQETISQEELSISSPGTEETPASSLNMETLEKNAILAALKKHEGNLTKASKELGMGRTTLYRKMKRYGEGRE
ncbi:MAG: sigma-54 dependent transcriptional regulator [Bacteroidetes bacterium]|nr:sigma-54 dependent transcriptional regulator [Bacteroidota bacterium]